MQCRCAVTGSARISFRPAPCKMKTFPKSAFLTRPVRSKTVCLDQPSVGALLASSVDVSEQFSTACKQAVAHAGEKCGLKPPASKAIARNQIDFNLQFEICNKNMPAKRAQTSNKESARCPLPATTLKYCHRRGNVGNKRGFRGKGRDWGGTFFIAQL